MPTMPINIIEGDATQEELLNELAKLQKVLRYLLNGQIDFENIRARSIKADNIEVGTLTAEEIMANTITADKMSVNELSAITANLGHITAGLIEAVTIIGSLIQTSPEGVFPRIELSSSNRVFRVQGSASEDLRMYVAGTQPILLFGNQFGSTLLEKNGSEFSVFNAGNININTGSGGRVNLNNVDVLSALNGKANAFTGITGSVSYTDVGGNPRTLIFSNGVLTGVI